MNYSEIDKLFGTPLNQVAKNTVQITTGMVIAGMVVLTLAAYGLVKLMEVDFDTKGKKTFFRND